MPGSASWWRELFCYSLADTAEPAVGLEDIACGDDSSSPSSTQAMNIREQIGYPDYILDDNNRHLDEEYSSVCAFSALPACLPPSPLF